MSSKTAAGVSPPLSDAYRTVWRWHFYAGIIVMPFLLLLALSGGVYLFKDEIDRLAYGRYITIPEGTAYTSPTLWAQAASEAAHGRAVSVLLPASPDEAVRIRVDRHHGEAMEAFVDPYTAKVTGIIPYGGVNETIRRLHSLSLTDGRLGLALNILVEVVAGWAIILCATGLYLWWPRKRRAAVLIPRETDARRRPFWRDLHALAGFYTAGIVIFLAVTGMPWSAIWGDRFMSVMRDTNLGRPPAPAALSWEAEAPHHAPEGQGWTMEHTVLPIADPHAHHRPTPSLDRVVKVVSDQNLALPVLINIPADGRINWSAATQPRKAQDLRVLYVDAATGAINGHARFAEFGPMAKGMEWGIMVHQGMQYGWINRMAMLAGCIGVWVLSSSGVVMWWKRRPPRLSPPDMGAPRTAPKPRLGVVTAIVLPLAILYPVTGASLLVALLVDRAILSPVRSRSPRPTLR